MKIEEVIATARSVAGMEEMPTELLMQLADIIEKQAEIIRVYADRNERLKRQVKGMIDG